MITRLGMMSCLDATIYLDIIFETNFEVTIYQCDNFV